jgi:AcrR family transcriptional regulator
MNENTYHHGNLKEALIAAGLKILSEDGVEGLSLRKVAREVGVSHTAPYNHFSDKQALLAAISTAGFEQLYIKLSETFKTVNASSIKIIPEIAWAYLQFALEDPGRFRLMFSGALEVETDHPDYLAVSRKNIAFFEEVIAYCQKRGELGNGKTTDHAIRIWSLVHGYTHLVLEDQFPQEYLVNQTLKDLLIVVLS